MNTLTHCKSTSLMIFIFLITVANAFSQAGRKPSLAVIEFEVRSPANRDVGRDLSDMLTNALLDNGRFTVVDRSVTNKITEEQKRVLLGSVDPATGAEIGKMTGAQFLVLGSVTELKEKKGGGLGGLGSILPGGGNIVTYQASVKFNLKVVNSTTGEISFSKSFEKEAKTTGIAENSGAYGVQLGDFRSKAIQDAVKQAIQDAVAVFVERIGSFTPSSPALDSQSPVNSSTNSVVDCSRITGGNAPRVMVVIPETHITQRIPDPAGETEIIKKLVARRFNVVDQKQVAVIRDREKVLTAVNNPQAAAALGIEFGADIIIIGEAFSELAGRDQGMTSTRARVEARAIQTDNARILAADGKFGSGLDIAETVSAKTALRNAGSQWADYFIAQICQAPPPNQTITSSIEILLSNVSYTQLKQFTDQLATVRGVKSVEKKLTDNVARITVQYDGSAEHLADAIAETKFGLMRVNIVGLSGNKIEIGIGK